MVTMQTRAGFFLLLLLLVFINSCIGNTSHETVVVFQDNNTKVQYTENDGNISISTPLAFTTLAVVGGVFKNKEFFTVMSSAHFMNSARGEYRDAVASTSYGDCKKWTVAEMFTNISKKSNEHSLYGDITAVIKGNKIYVLTTNTEKVRSVFNENEISSVWNNLMSVGTVMNLAESQSESDVFVNWGPAQPLRITLPNSNEEVRGMRFWGAEGKGIVTEKGTIIFPILLIKNEKTVGSTLYSINDGSTWHVGGETERVSKFGSVIQWKKEKLFFIAPSYNGCRDVFESDDMGITWKKSPVLFGVWGNDQSRSSYENPGSAITVTVENKDVLLFAHPLNKKRTYYLDTLQLWLSDGQRIVCIGAISDEKKEVSTARSILVYVNEHLYVAHQINPSARLSGETDLEKVKWNRVIGLTPLPDFLEKVKTTVGFWRQLDERYQGKGIPTNGLVGFLGHSKDNTVWADMYNCVHATVTGGQSVSGGFRFDGKAGSGAKWPVKSQGQNQVYKFTDNEFTLTASLKIHTTNEATNVSLISGSFDDDGEYVMLGFGFTHERKWYTIQSYRKSITAISAELEKEYHVAITLINKVLSVFVNGEDIANKSTAMHSSLSISHFFIGGTLLSSSPKANGNPCTVKNVMLFSRALQKNEIDELIKITGISELNKQIITENERIEREKKTAVSTVKSQSAPESQALMSNTKSTIKPEIRSTVLQNHIGSASQTGKSDLNTKSTIAPEDHQSVFNTQFARTGEHQKTNSNNKEMSTQKNTQTILLNTVTTAPTSQERLLTKNPNEKKAVVQQSVTTDKDKVNKIINSVKKYGTAGVQTNIPGDNGVIVSLAAVFWISLLCTLISMTVF